MTTDEKEIDDQIEQFEQLIELIRTGDTETAIAWCEAAVKVLTRQKRGCRQVLRPLDTVSV